MNNRIIIILVCLLTLVTQVSADDMVTINNFSITSGETKTLSIELENDVAYAAFQFDLYLPVGMTIVSYNADNSRVPNSTDLSMIKQDDDSYRFLAAPMGLEEISGTSGSIITINVKADESIASSTLTGYFRKVKLSTLEGTGPTYNEMPFQIVVTNPIQKGDVNGNGEVDIDDAVCILRHLVNKPNDKFVEAAADVNGNDEIDIDDAVMVLKYLVGKIDALSRGKVQNTDMDEYDPD